MTDHAGWTPELPPPRQPESPYVIAMVCLGNICRSPMAQVVLTEKLLRLGMAERVEVRSCGTGDWHVGEEMDSRAAASLAAAGYDPSLHRASHFDASWFDSSDLLLAMDHTNLRDVCAAAGSEDLRSRVLRFREFDPDATDDDRDVPDPWYGGPSDFAAVLDIVERTTDVLVEQLHARA
jgi:low molecular weight protein-tyrosine phosphatase